MTELRKAAVEQLWQEFQMRQQLTDEQREQFKTYYQLLVDTNEIHNLTAITNISEIIKYHFEDSLALATAVDMQKISRIVDVGSGGGFPGVPLKIKYPHLEVTLIEVNHKKVDFLQEVIAQLKLTHCALYDLDWRTFLRKTSQPVDLFCARASLQPEELLRMFKPSSPYKKDTLIYWASVYWKPEPIVKPYIVADVPYTIGKKTRRLISLKAPQNSAEGIHENTQ